MPTTFFPANHSPEPVDPNRFPNPGKGNRGIAFYLLKEACHQQFKRSDHILQSSFDNTQNDPDVVAQRNGFVSTVLCAYNHHHALIIRPDDVWLAILVQFSSFVNANAEKLRSQFVSHEGKKELTVKNEQLDIDYAVIVNMLTTEIEKNIVDPSLRDWVLPNFSTTTPNDTTVCSIIMMASMKKYFDYKVFTMCGIPSVTLDGEKQDWETILERLERFKEYGLEMIAWYHLLRPIIARFVQAFDAPHAQENLNFWQKVAHHEEGGSGPSYLCGWITAFCVFNDDGKWLGNKIKANSQESSDAGSLSAKDFFSTYVDTPALPDEFTHFGKKPDERASLQLDGARYHIIESNDIPSGYSEVDVLLDVNGVEYQCMMVAGAVGMRLRTGEGGLSGVKDTVQPVAGWWMFTKKSEDQVQAEEREEHDRIFSGLNAMMNRMREAQELEDTEEFSLRKKEEKLQAEPKGAGCCNCLIM